MLNHPLFKQVFILLVVIGISDFFANKFYFYWTVWWFDMYMHTIAGVCIGLFSVLFWQNFFDKNISLLKSVVVSVFITLFIAALWEIFEVYSGAADMADGIKYVTDTTSDTLLALSGSLLSALYAHHILFKNNNHA